MTRAIIEGVIFGLLAVPPVLIYASAAYREHDLRMQRQIDTALRPRP